MPVPEKLPNLQEECKENPDGFEMSQVGKRAVDMLYDLKSDKYQANTINELYNKMGGEGYDEWARVVNFTEPYEIAKQVYQSEQEEAIDMPRDSAILDVGAGTGIIGKCLTKQGYTNMQALDASEEFQKSLCELGAYQDVHQQYLGYGVDNLPAHLKGRFDCVTASGVFLLKHMPKEAMDDIHATLKSGGYFITAMRSYLYANGEECGYKDKIDELIEAGKFELVRTKRFMRGTKEGSGLFGLMESILVVLRRID